MGTSGSSKTKKTRSRGRQEQFKAVQSARHKENISPRTLPKSFLVTSRTRHKALVDELDYTKSRLVDVQQNLTAQQHQTSRVQAKFSNVSTALVLSRTMIDDLEDRLEVEIEKSDRRYELVRNERRRVTRAEKKSSKLLAELLHIKTTELPGALKLASDAAAKLLCLSLSSNKNILRLTRAAHSQSLQITTLRTKLQSSRKIISSLKKQCIRASNLSARAISRAKHTAANKSSTFELC